MKLCLYIVGKITVMMVVELH